MAGDLLEGARKRIDALERVVEQLGGILAQRDREEGRTTGACTFTLTPMIVEAEGTDRAAMRYAGTITVSVPTLGEDGESAIGRAMRDALMECLSMELGDYQVEQYVRLRKQDLLEADDDAEV